MFECPKVLFINCLGSYFYSILQSIGGTIAEKELLCYLSSGALRYEKLNQTRYMRSINKILGAINQLK